MIFYLLKNKRDPEMYEIATKHDKCKWMIWGLVHSDILGNLKFRPIDDDCDPCPDALIVSGSIEESDIE